MNRCPLMQLMALTAVNMVTKAALSAAFAAFPPSAVAAACLCKARESIGLEAAWPGVLLELTQLLPASDPALRSCLELLQLLGISN